MTADAALASLTQHNAGSWAAVADVLSQLDHVSSASPEGRSWNEVVADRLAEVGHPVSVGHLRKLKRVWRFLSSEGNSITADGRAFTTSDLQRASLLAIETASRLFDLDPEAGRTALQDCLTGTPNSEIQRRLESARAAHPQRRSARQAGWEKRRKAQETPDPAVEAAEAMATNPAAWWGSIMTRPALIVPGEIIPLLGRTPAGVVYETNSGMKTGGVRYVETTTKWLDTLESVLAQSEFFDRYWLVAAEESLPLIRIYEHLLDYGSQNVGLLSFQNGQVSMIACIPEDVPSVVRPALTDAIKMARLKNRPTAR